MLWWSPRIGYDAPDTELPPLPEAVHHLAATATDDRVYVTGGYTNLLFSEITKRAWAYEPEAERWTRIADLPGPRAAHGMAAIEGRLYAVGGVGPASEETWVYEPATDRWDAAPAPLPTRREHLAVTVVDGKLYAVGGRWGDAGNLAGLEIYDPAAGTWTRGPDLPTPRSGLTASGLEGRIHVAGGESLSGARTFGEHEAYDPSSEAWSRLADLPTARHGLASAVAGGRWYVIGGGTKAGALTFVSLTDLIEVSPAAQGDQSPACHGLPSALFSRAGFFAASSHCRLAPRCAYPAQCRTRMGCAGCARNWSLPADNTAERASWLFQQHLLERRRTIFGR